MEQLVISLCEDTGSHEMYNKVLMYEGTRTELEQILSVALPRSEAAQIPAIAFTRGLGNDKPCSVTFKAGRFSIIDWNKPRPAWYSMEADLTSSVSDMLEQPGQESMKEHFERTNRVYIFQFKATLMVPPVPDWQERSARKRRIARMTAM